MTVPETGPTMEVDLQAIATWVLGHDTAETRRAAAKWVTGLLETAMVAPSPDDTGRSTMSLPDPRPTEAEVRDALISRDLDVHYRDVLRSLGCFRPEPADEPERRSPSQRWDGHCCPNDPECEHSYLDMDDLTRWMGTPLTDAEAAEIADPADPVPVVEPPTDSAFTRCPFCSYILPPGSIIGARFDPAGPPL